MDKVLNAYITELCGEMKGVDKRTDEGFLQRFSCLERMEDDRIAKDVYLGECAGSCSVGRP